MISDLLTIVIPCKDSVIELKRTVEDITKKTKIKGTRVLVLDFGSIDGSYQYASQASSEHIRKIRIESIRMKEGESIKDSLKLINTPYVLLLSPGSTFKEEDLILNSVNRLSRTKIPLVYLKNCDFIRNLMSSLIRSKRKVNAVFSGKEVLSILDYKPEDGERKISFEDISNDVEILGFTD